MASPRTPRMLLAAVLAGLLLLTWCPVHAALPPADQKRADEARALRGEHKYEQAEKIYASLVKKHRDDAQLLLDAGYTMFMHAGAVDNPKQATQLRMRGRALIVRAQELGLKDALIDMCLGATREDGSVVPGDGFSPHQAAEASMRAGEKAFAKGDLDGALRAYQEALKVDPQNYHAALYIGDVHFNRKEFDLACEWFERAVKLDPNIETAYRYWGDAARRAGRNQEALRHYIEAVIAEPYARAPRQMLEAYAKNSGLKWRSRTFALPFAPVELKDGKSEIKVDPDDGAVVLLYALACVQWRSDEFSKYYSDEKPRRSLREEMHALTLLSQMAREMKESDPDSVAAWTAGLETLDAVVAADLLAPFVLLERVDADIAKDYAAYRILSRDRLFRYIAQFWCGLEPAADDTAAGTPGS